MISSMHSGNLHRTICIALEHCLVNKEWDRTRVASLFESCCPFSKQGRGSVFSTHFGSALILFYVVHTCC